MFDIVVILCEDDIFASKVAASISSFCKFYLQFGDVKIIAYLEKGSTSLGAIRLDFGENPEGFNTDKISRSLLFGIGKIIVRENVIEIRYQHQYNFDFIAKAKEVFNIKTVDELMNDIKSKNKELESSLSNLKKAKDLNARMEGELEVGQNIQMSMLPDNEYSSECIDVYAFLAPAREVGGDFYDFFFIDDDHICFVVGDVSGKGVPAALMMAVCKTLLKSQASNNKSTASVLSHVNKEMARENKNYMFVTVFMAIFNTSTGVMKYTNAGHNPTYIKRKNGSIEKLTTLHGPVVAAMEGLTYKESEEILNSGDFVFIYTDGIPEAHNDKGEIFTDEALEHFLREEKFASVKTTVEHIIETVEKFENGANRFDDITALCIDYKGNGSNGN
jgi:sigma-B regulation protein RsbU (phosphoserine phosphatase)